MGTILGVSEWVQERRRKEGMGTRKVEEWMNGYKEGRCEWVQGWEMRE